RISLVYVRSIYQKGVPMSHGFTSDLKMKFNLPAPADAKTAAAPPPAGGASQADVTATDATPDDDSPANPLIDLLPNEQRRAIELLVKERSDLHDPNAHARRPRPNMTK